MASKKTFEIAFKIGAQVASSFGTGFKSANKALNDLNNNTSKLKKNMEGLQGLAQKGLAIGGVGLAGAGFAVNEAIKFESAMADVKKVFNGTDAELKALNDEILNMSTRLPMAAEDIAKIAAAAGQAGIATKEIAKFTEDAVKMGVAFDISADEAGQAMAEMRTAFKLNQKEVVTLADKINYLGNNTPAAAKGIMEIVQRIGPLGEVGGFASGSIAALGATIRGMGVQEEIAATGIKNMMLALTAGESATKGQHNAYVALGLDATKVAKSMQVDAEKTTLTVLKAIGKLEKYQQAAMLSELFGKESLSSIAPLLTNMAALEKNLNMVADATKYAGSMEAEYAARAATTENQLILAKSTMKALAIDIGSTLLPYVNQALKAFQNVILQVRTWAKANPELAANLTKIAIVVAAVVAGLSALAIGFIALVGPITMAISIFSKLSIAITIIRAIGTAFLWVGRIFMLNPIGLVITAIIAAIYLLWTNWDTVSKYIAKGWDVIKQGGQKLLTWFQSLPSTFYNFGLNLLQGLANGIKSGVTKAVAAAGEAAAAIKNKVKDFFGINSPSKVFAEFGMWNMQGLANGMTDNAPAAATASQSAVSGVMPSGNSITSNNSSSSYTINLTVQGGGQDVAQQAQKGVMDAVKQIEKAKAREARLSYA